MGLVLLSPKHHLQNVCGSKEASLGRFNQGARNPCRKLNGGGKKLCSAGPSLPFTRGSAGPSLPFTRGGAGPSLPFARVGAGHSLPFTRGGGGR